VEKKNAKKNHDLHGRDNPRLRYRGSGGAVGVRSLKGEDSIVRRQEPPECGA